MHNYSSNEKPGRSHSIRVTTPIPDGKSVAECRIISRMLITMLVTEMKDCNTAAKVVSGIHRIFNIYSRLIDDAIALVDEQPACASFTTHLKPILDTAEAEISENQKLEMDILAALPDDDCCTYPLIQALSGAAESRTRLLHNIKMAPDRWRKAQVRAFRSNTDSPHYTISSVKDLDNRS